jgi:hypothetical protein
MRLLEEYSMQRLVIASLVVLLTGSSVFAATLEEGTEVYLKLKHKARSNEVKKGQRLAVVVKKPVTNSAGETVIAKGARGWAEVTECSLPAGKDAGMLTVEATEVTAVDGSKVKLRGLKSARGEDGVGWGVMFVQALCFGYPVSSVKGTNGILRSWGLGSGLRGFVDKDTELGSKWVANVDGEVIK